VVATLGTAVTSGHLRQLQRSVSEIVLALDADAAGQAATWRTLQLAEATLRSGLKPVVGPNRRQQRYVLDQPVRLRVLAVPDAKDPDELIRGDPSQWPALIQAALPVVEFVLERLASRHDLATAQGKAAAAAEAVEVLAGIADPIEQAHYVQQLALVLRVDEGAVRQALKRSRRPGRPSRELDAERKDAGAAWPEDAAGDADDDYVLALVLRLRELDPLAEPGELEFVADDSRVLLRAVQAGGSIHPELQPRLERVQLQRQLVEHFSLAQLRRELDRKRLELRRRALQQRQALLHQQMREAAAAERLELAPTLTEVAREISRIDEALQRFDARGVRDGAASA
jgi:DNA primase